MPTLHIFSYIQDIEVANTLEAVPHKCCNMLQGMFQSVDLHWASLMRFLHQTKQTNHIGWVQGMRRVCQHLTIPDSKKCPIL